MCTVLRSLALSKDKEMGLGTADFSKSNSDHVVQQI